MNLDEARERVGQQVLYQARHGGDQAKPCLVTWVGDYFVYVKVEGSHRTEAVPAARLTAATP